MILRHEWSYHESPKPALSSNGSLSLEASYYLMVLGYRISVVVEREGGAGMRREGVASPHQQAL